MSVAYRRSILEDHGFARIYCTTYYSHVPIGNVLGEEVPLGVPDDIRHRHRLRLGTRRVHEQIFTVIGNYRDHGLDVFNEEAISLFRLPESPFCGLLLTQIDKHAANTLEFVVSDDRRRVHSHREHCAVSTHGLVLDGRQGLAGR